MSISAKTYAARGRSDGEDRLLEAEEPLASLQTRCGGAVGQTIAIPELLALTRKARSYGLRLSREISATDGDDTITAWVEVTPRFGDDESGCDIGIVSWHNEPLPPESEAETARLRVEIDRHLGEFTARLGPNQNILSAESEAPDLQQLRESMQTGVGRAWTEFVDFPELSVEQPVHWRLLDGARCEVAGSERNWTVTLVPLGQPDAGSSGFELYLSADTPLADAADGRNGISDEEDAPSLGRNIAPVLREPLTRIVGNAETIRSRLAGPLADEYSNYAGDIAEAAQHLLGLIDDLADLEAVEDHNFSTAPDQIDLMDAARRASAMLGGKAQERDIRIVIPPEGTSAPAVGEFRRVMQVLLNLLGNALRYSPEGSTVTLSLDRAQGFATLTVADEGEGLSPEQQQLVFEKFERLGRSGDGGSGLGLYISRRIARAMGGDLTVDSAPGKGARFTLVIPAG